MKKILLILIILCLLSSSCSYKVCSTYKQPIKYKGYTTIRKPSPGSNTPMKNVTPLKFGYYSWEN